MTPAEQALEEIREFLGLPPDSGPITIMAGARAVLNDRDRIAGFLGGVEAMRDQMRDQRDAAEAALGDLVDAVVTAVRELRNPPPHAPPHQLVAIMARIATDLHNAEPADGPPLPVAGSAPLPGVG